MSQFARSLSEENANTTSFSRQQNRAVLIAGLTCACFSVLATLVTLRWFIMMKRDFRHRLVMFLIFSDTFKAFWYFLFPVVVFAAGPVQSSSGFCQATGFFLAVGIEASDFAILMIALHSILYIFHPPTRSGEVGGIYRWRKFIYPFWIGLPVLAASLAFINHQNGYTTTGTFCYLPRRPFWYRLALSWIPRYCILLLIFSMYTAVYIYVTLKFRSFGSLHESDSSNSHSRQSSLSVDDVAPDDPTQPLELESPKKPRFGRPDFSRSGSYKNEVNPTPKETNPWDEVSFITTGGLRNAAPWQPGVHTSDVTINNRDMSTSDSAMSPRTTIVPTRLLQSAPSSRKVSNCPTTNSQWTGETATTTFAETQARHISQAAQKLDSSPTQTEQNDPLQSTRKAIRKQLRYLFIYPAVYVFMWAFPFAQHCLLYDDYYVQNPIFWLSIVSTCMFSLQAGVDCLVFSWREKPWRRIPDDHRLSLQIFRPSFSTRHNSNANRSGRTSIVIVPDQGNSRFGSLNGVPSGLSSRTVSTHWWEAEGRRRKDSVWMGTDSHANGPALERLETIDTQPEVLTPTQEVDEERLSTTDLGNGRPSEAYVEGGPRASATDRAIP